MKNELYRKAKESLVFKIKDHHRFITDDDKDIYFNIVTLSYNLGSRIPAICNNFETAREFVLNNASDMYECSYGLVVIEGFYINKMYSAIEREQYWYAWHQDELKYKAIEKPAIYNNICGFGMG